MLIYKKKKKKRGKEIQKETGEVDGVWIKSTNYVVHVSLYVSHKDLSV